MSALAMILMAGMIRDAGVSDGKVARGQVIPQDSKWIEVNEGWVWEFRKGGKLLTSSADGSKDIPSRYELNPKANPPQIDIITIDGTSLGIYRLRDDHLEIYWAIPGMKRPTKFVDGKDEDGAPALSKFKRAK